MSLPVYRYSYKIEGESRRGFAWGSDKDTIKTHIATAAATSYNPGAKESCIVNANLQEEVRKSVRLTDTTETRAWGGE